MEDHPPSAVQFIFSGPLVAYVLAREKYESRHGADHSHRKAQRPSGKFIQGKGKEMYSIRSQF